MKPTTESATQIPALSPGAPRRLTVAGAVHSPPRGVSLDSGPLRCVKRTQRTRAVPQRDAGPIGSRSAMATPVATHPHARPG